MIIQQVATFLPFSAWTKGGLGIQLHTKNDVAQNFVFGRIYKRHSSHLIDLEMVLCAQNRITHRRFCAIRVGFSGLHQWGKRPSQLFFRNAWHRHLRFIRRRSQIVSVSIKYTKYDIASTPS